MCSGLANFLNSLFNRFKGQEKKSTGAPSVQTAARVKKEFHYGKIVEAIDELISSGAFPGLQKKEDTYLISYYAGTRRICDVNKCTDPPRTCFFYSGANLKARELDRPGLRALSRNEARQKGYGHAKAIYSGTDTETVLNMLRGARN